MANNDRQIIQVNQSQNKQTTGSARRVCVQKPYDSAERWDN